MICLNSFEKLLEQTAKDKLDVVTYRFDSNRIKGLYCDNTIALSKNLDTTAERSSVLAEEMGHHYTTAGDIIDPSDSGNRKQELRARAWAYNKMVGIRGIIGAYEHRCRNLCDMADFLEVTPAFLMDAFEYYKSKYGVYVEIDNYIVFFEPVGVLKVDI